MRNILIDAGPLIALFDRSDQYHLKSLAFMKDSREKFWTTWPVITEVCHMLDFNVQAQLNFITWIYRGGLKIFEINSDQIYRIIELTEKYSDVPMDLADATLIIASEQTGVKEIASIDSDFYIYRNIRNQFLQNIFI